jgi:hypothetical protein
MDYKTLKQSFEPAFSALSDYFNGGITAPALAFYDTAFARSKRTCE